MNLFFQNSPSILFLIGCAIFSVSCSENGDSAAMKETLLQTEVELLSKRLESLDQEMDLQVLQLEKDQRLLIRGSSMSIRDLGEANLTAKIERFLLSPEDFSTLLENGNVSELHNGIQKLVSENKATAKPIFIASLSTVIRKGEPPKFAVSDQKNLNVLINFEPVSENEIENPDPKLAPNEWMKEDLGTSFTAELLAREDVLFLLDLKFKDITRLKNECYPFPKIFVEKDPGHLDMPVFHQGEIETTITAAVGVAEFIGTTIIPGFKDENLEQFQAVFITILSDTK